MIVLLFSATKKVMKIFNQLYTHLEVWVILLFDRLPDWVVPEPKILDSVMRLVEHQDSVMRPVECLSLPTQTDNSNDNNESVTSQISNDGSDIIPVDEYIKQYLMKGSIYILKNSTTITFDYTQEFYSRDLLESMNET